MSKPIGGVRGVTLRFATEQNAQVQVVPLVDDSSEYVQMVDCTKCIIGVTHTLTLEAQRCNASPWLSLDFIERATIDGVIATVELNDGRVVDIGNSSTPLRVCSIKDASRTSCSHIPTVTLTLKCENLTLTQ